MTFQAVYVIGVGERPVKIGTTTNIEARLRSLQISVPQPLVVHYRANVPEKLAFKVERGCHEALAEFRMMGEWFDVTADHAKDTVRHIAEMMVARRGAAVTDVVTHLATRFQLDPDARAAIEDYKMCAKGIRKSPRLDGMERAVTKIAGWGALVALRYVVRDRHALTKAMGECLGANRRAEKSLAAAINALADWRALEREQALLDEIA